MSGIPLCNLMTLLTFSEDRQAVFSRKRLKDLMMIYQLSVLMEIKLIEHAMSMFKTDDTCYQVELASDGCYYGRCN
jgi:hypothetical protein